MTLPPFKPIRIYVSPQEPETVPAEGVTLEHTERTVLVAPDQAVEIHDAHIETHEEPVEGRNNLYRSTAPRAIRYSSVNGKTKAQRIGRVNLCHVLTSVSDPVSVDERHRDVIGTKEEVAAYLRPQPCTPPADTGWVARVAEGHYYLDGECSPVTLQAGSHGHSLDPARLTGTEWEVIRPQSGASTYRWQITRRATPAPTFTIQQWVPPSEPSGQGAWRDLTASVIGLQAGVRLRVKTEEAE